MERKVEELSAELLAQATRIARLEQDVGAVKPRVLQEKEDQLLRLLQVQQEELERLRSKQECLAAQYQHQREDGEQPTVVATRSLEVQHKDLVMELRVLQQDQHWHKRFSKPEPSPPAPWSAHHLQVEAATDAVEMLKELREERGLITEMLYSVKQEKCEVIAMMHAFALDKGEAFEELEGLRRAAREDVAMVSVPNPLNHRVLEGTHLAIDDTHERALHIQKADRDEARGDEAPPPLSAVPPAQLLPRQGGDGAWRRQSSRPSLCTTATAPFPVAHHAAGLAASPLATGSRTVPGMIQQQPFVVPGQPAPQGPCRVCSPVRQYSASMAAGIFPVSVACSPAVMTRTTTSDPRPSQAGIDPRRSPVSQAGIDPRRSPVRRFVSAGGLSGLSSRAHDPLG